MRGWFVTVVFEMSMVRGVFSLMVVVVVRAALNAGRTSLIDGFKECLASGTPSTTLSYCVGYDALSRIQLFDNQPEFQLVDGLSFSRDEKMYRDAGGYNVLETADPADFRSVIDSVGQVFSRRSMRWDMGFIYPGLAMRLAPSSASAGLLEFVMDGASYPQHSLKEASTARLLAKQFVLPFLLGFKFNVATLLPIFFGIIALLAKKAVFFSKIALIISSAFGLGTLMLGHYHNTPSPGFGYQTPHSPGIYNPHLYRFPDESSYHDSSYRSAENQPEDQLRMYEGELQQAYSREDNKKGRNFAWSESDKSTKS